MEINKLVFQAYEAPNSEKSKTRSFFNTSWLKLHLFCNSTTSSCKATLCYASMALYMLCLLTRVFCSSTFFLKNSYSSLKTLFKHHSSCANLLTFPGRLILSCMLLLYLNLSLWLLVSQYSLLKNEKFETRKLVCSEHSI